MKKHKGFSLIELLIVVAIILIIAAIAIPNLMRSRIAANEASATGALRTINTAEITFSSTYNSGFSADLRQLAPPTPGTQASVIAADLLDPVLSAMAAGNVSASSFTKSGYLFLYTPTGANTTFGFIAAYTINADPQQRGTSGQRSFFTSETGVVRFNATANATVSDNPL